MKASKSSDEVCKFEFLPIFPVAVGVYDDFVFSKKELAFLSKIKMTNNLHNKMSVSSSVLEEKSLERLKTFLSVSVNHYFNSVCIPKDGNIELEITQSWLNESGKDEFHHTHIHYNSVLSGVFYIQADEKLDSIKVNKEHFRSYIPYEILPKNLNIFNAVEITFPVNTGRLLIFPSLLSHGVDPIDTDRKRISLSFNTFFKKGTIGGESHRTMLNFEA